MRVGRVDACLPEVPGPGKGLRGEDEGKAASPSWGGLADDASTGMARIVLRFPPKVHMSASCMNLVRT